MHHRDSLGQSTPYFAADLITDSVNVARDASLIGTKSPAKGDARLTENNLQTGKQSSNRPLAEAITGTMVTAVICFRPRPAVRIGMDCAYPAACSCMLPRDFSNCRWDRWYGWDRRDRRVRQASEPYIWHPDCRVKQPYHISRTGTRI